MEEQGSKPATHQGSGPPVEPSVIRAKLMLETASHMMSEYPWPYREARLSLKSQGDQRESFMLYGANHPDSVVEVFERKTDISVLNPCCVLRMGYRGVGFYLEPMQLATIAVIPHYDQLGFAVTKASGLTSLDDIREKRFPLRVSVRGSLDVCTGRTVELVLKAHGFSFADIAAWGGFVSYDQGMPPEPSRMGRVASGEFDAIFDEAVVMWANKVEAVGMQFLEVNEQRMSQLEAQGLTRGVIEKSRYDTLPADVQTVDFSGWPIYCRIDTSPLLIRQFCEAMIARKDNIPWHMGPKQQEPLPLERMVMNSPETPLDVPFHTEAEKVWKEHGLF